jgi:iron complex transport system substrate-binding protein
MDWDDVANAQPEMIIVSPCGYRLERAAEFARHMPRMSDAAVYAVDANALCGRAAGVEGVELLARLFHPDLPWSHVEQPWDRIY